MHPADVHSTTARGRSAPTKDAERPSSVGGAIASSLGADFRSRMSREIVLARADSDFVNELFTWHDLNLLLDRRSVFPADLQLSKQGRVLARSEYADPNGILDLQKLTSCVRQGASVIIDGLDRVDERVKNTTTDIMRLTGETASCNLFVTFHDSQAFHPHFDEVDTVIMQLEGTKHWQVHGPSEIDPLPEYGDSDPRNCPDDLLLDTVLRPGDVLHVPRGWWHTVRGAGGRSLHVTFAFTRKTGFDLVRWIAWKSLIDPRIRQSLDRWGSLESRDLQQKEILAAFAEVAASHTIDGFLEAERSSADGWQSSSLPWSINDDSLPGELGFRVLTVFEPMLTVDEDAVRFSFAGSVVALPAAYASALHLVFELQASTISALAHASATPERAIVGLLRKLQELGIVAFA